MPHILKKNIRGSQAKKMCCICVLHSMVMCGITCEVGEQLKSHFSAVTEMSEYELSDWGSVKNSEIIEFLLQSHIQSGCQTYSTF